MKRLSEMLQNLSGHAADAETRVAAAEADASAKLHTAIEKSKADAQARQDRFESNLAKTKADAASDWEKLRADHKNRVGKIKGNIAKKEDAIDRKLAERRADDAEAYAEDMVYFASTAIDDSAVAVLEAIEARAYADSLAESGEASN